MSIVGFMKKLISFIVFNILFIKACYAEELTPNAADRYVYLGTEFGLSDPIVKSFKHKDSDTKIRLKKSHMYGGKLGYSFYPNMMVEISGTHQPKYRLAYRLPEVPLFPGFLIPETPGVTRVSANVFTLNFIYELEKITSFGIKPYAIFGAGVAQISVKPTISYWKPPAFLGMGTDNVAIFKIKRSTQNCFAWQAGIGLSKDITSNFAVDFAAKMQVVNDIRIKYQTLDTATRSFDEAKPIKKTIGVGEFTVGLTYKFPL